MVEVKVGVKVGMKVDLWVEVKVDLWVEMVKLDQHVIWMPTVMVN
jgi:hypothetical protein